MDEFLGAYDAPQERLKGKTGAYTDTEFQKDFDALDNILGKELSNYMQQISGATVGDREVERLKRQVPNLDMSETQFDEAMDLYQESLNNANSFFLENYGFSDLNTAKNTILGKQTQTTGSVKYK